MLVEARLPYYIICPGGEWLVDSALLLRSQRAWDPAVHVMRALGPGTCPDPLAYQGRGAPGRDDLDNFLHVLLRRRHACRRTQAADMASTRRPASDSYGHVQAGT